MKMDSFDKVAETYKNTKQKISTKFDKDLNYRPLRVRSFRDHIVRFNANTYGIFDGDIGDPLFDWMDPNGQLTRWLKRYYDKPAPWITKKQAMQMAPILWRKVGEVEEITIRNALKDAGVKNNRLRFLRTHLPRGVWVPHTNNGRQYVEVCGKKYYLAETTKVPPSAMEHLLNANHPPYIKRRFKALVPMKSADQASLVFRRKQGGVWEYYSGGVQEMKKLRRIDMETKKSYRGHIKDFYESFRAVYPLLMQNKNSWEFSRDIREEVKGLKEQGYLKVPSRGPYIRKEDDPAFTTLFRDAVKEEDHPGKMLVFYFLCYRMGYTQHEDEGSFRKDFNNEINKFLNFYCTVEVPV